MDVGRRSRGIGRLALAGAALALVLAPATPAGAAPVPKGSTWHEQSIHSSDGTRLHLDVFRPSGGGRTPVILIPSRYFATGTGADPRSPTMLDYYDDIHARAYSRGYTIVQLTPRGYGRSGGCTDWRGPGERNDVITAIRWSATQPWSTGKVGTYGLSYDGALQVAALSQRVPGHAAAVPIGAPTTAYRPFYMRRVRYQPFAALSAPYTLAYAFPNADPSSVDAALLAAESRLMNAGCLLDTSNWMNPNPAAPYWRVRDYEGRAARTRVPTLWSQGLLDWSVHPDGLAALWPRLHGPKRMWLGQHPHLVPSEWERGHPEVVGRRGWTEEVFRFFGRHLKRNAAKADPAVVVQEGFAGRWRGEPSWPPLDARRAALPVLSGSYTDGPGNKGEGFCTRTEAHCVPGRTGVGSWTFTPPLPHDAHLSGVPRLRVNVATGARNVNVVALLYDVDQWGRAALMTRGAALAPASGPIALELYLQDWLLRRGHRIGLLLAGSDDWWFEPGHTGARVDVVRGALSMPFLHYRRTRFLAGGPSQAIRDRTTFMVGQAVRAKRTVPAWAPPALRSAPALRLSVRPNAVPAERRSVLSVRVRAYGRPLRGVLVRAAGARARTGRRGRALLPVTPHGRGPLEVRASVPGLGTARALVTVRTDSD